MIYTSTLTGEDDQTRGGGMIIEDGLAEAHRHRKLADEGKVMYWSLPTLDELES